MLNKFCELVNCKDVIRIHDNIFYISGKTLFVLDIQGGFLEKYESTEEIFKLHVCLNMILLTNDRGQVLEISDCKWVLKKPNILLPDFRVYSIANERYAKYSTRGDNPVSGFYDLKKSKVIFESRVFFGNELFDDLIFSKGNRLQALDINSSQKILDISIEQISDKELRFSRILGIIDNKVIVNLSDGTILVLNIITQEIKKWKAFDNKYLSHKTLNTTVAIPIYGSELHNKSRSVLIHKQDNNKIIGIEYGVYWELNLDTNLLKAESLYEEFKGNEVCGCWSGISLKDNIFYFFSDQSFNRNDNHKLVSFDYKSKKIIEQWSLPKIKRRERRGFDMNGPKLLGSSIIAAFEQNGNCHLFQID